MSDHKPTNRTIHAKYNAKFNLPIFLLLEPVAVDPPWSKGDRIELKVHDMKAEISVEIAGAFPAATLEDQPDGLYMICAQIDDAQAAKESYTQYWMRKCDIETMKFRFLLCKKV